jgi:hypothetical protein
MHSQLDVTACLRLDDDAVVESLSRCLTPKLDQLRGKKIVFSREDRKLTPFDGWGLGNSSSDAITTVRPIKESMVVAAVDSSCVKLAETEEGNLYAVKCGIATAYAGRALMHFRMGPVLFYLSESTARESEMEEKLARAVLIDDDLAKRLIRVRAERALQNELAGHFVNSIILVDGSLRSSLFEDKRCNLTRISERCLLRKNTIIGISKGTKLKALERVAAPLLKIPQPAYIQVGVIVKSLIRNSIGSNLMVRLDSNAPVLRADVLGGGDYESLGRLLGNDPVADGYPETLRLAHHISTFTATEMTCLRGHVLNNYQVTELAAGDVRRTLLGSISV